MDEKTFFILCEKCGKRLIERLPNGLFRFLFGRRKRTGEPVVNMLIHGSVRVMCLRGTCGHENTLTFFPPNFNLQSPPGEKSPEKEESPKLETKDILSH